MTRRTGENASDEQMSASQAAPSLTAQSLVPCVTATRRLFNVSLGGHPMTIISHRHSCNGRGRGRAAHLDPTGIMRDRARQRVM